MKLRITLEGKTYEVDVEVLEEGSTTSHLSSTAIHTNPMPAPVATEKPVITSQPSPSTASASGNRVVKAPIVGTIIQLLVTPGDTVSINQVLLVMEAMKMETNVASPLAGKVKAVHVSPGDAVKTGQVLVELE